MEETLRLGGVRPENYVIDPEAPSAARVVYEYFGGRERFVGIPQEMMRAVDQADSARYSREDILAPGGWTLLNYIMDPRTGLGRFRQFRISNYDLMMELIEHCRTNLIEDILQLPDVKERTELYFEQQPRAVEQIRRCSSVHGKLVVLDLRDEDVIWSTNRFMIYALFPQCNISMHVLWGLKKQNTVFARGQIHSRPVQHGQYRAGHADPRRRRASGRRNLPGAQRAGRGSAARACTRLAGLSRKNPDCPVFCRKLLFFPRLP